MPERPPSELACTVQSRLRYLVARNRPHRGATDAGVDCCAAAIELRQHVWIKENGRTVDEHDAARVGTRRKAAALDLYEAFERREDQIESHRYVRRGVAHTIAAGSLDNGPISAEVHH